MSLDNRWSSQLSELREHGRFRELTPPNGVDFSSNDYLAFGAQELLLEESLATSGCASRLLRGHQRIWDDVESMLAKWHGVESALMMTSGYVANEGLLSTIIEPNDWVASDQFNHASIIDGLRMSRAERFVYRHIDLNHLEDGLRAAKRRQREYFVVTESLFSMEGTRAPLRAMADLCERHGAHLIVDEAHSTGCFGETGAGLIEVECMRDRTLASIHTGGKALGLCGAYVCGSRQLMEMLINRCRQFIFTTALPPIVGAWWLQRIAQVQQADERRNQLHQQTRMLREELADVPVLGNDHIAPIVIGPDDKSVQVAQLCQDGGFDVRSIRPPSVADGTARLRLSVHADRTEDELKKLGLLIKELLGKI